MHRERGIDIECQVSKYGTITIYVFSYFISLWLVFPSFGDATFALRSCLVAVYFVIANIFISFYI